jgi:hypothetical protein
MLLLNYSLWRTIPAKTRNGTLHSLFQPEPTLDRKWKILDRKRTNLEPGSVVGEAEVRDAGDDVFTLDVVAEWPRRSGDLGPVL